VATIYPVKGSSTRFAVRLLNGKEFQMFLNSLDLKMSRIVARQAVGQGAQVIADEWKRLVPTHEGHYRESIRVTTRSSTMGSEVEGVRVIRGASAVVQPRPVGVPDPEQPFRYAGVLEYGGRLTPAQRSSYIPAQPSLRPAFDNKAEAAVDKVNDIIGALLG
jgi:HK97 gp10 family phage protein